MRNWVYKLDFEYKNIKIEVYINEYKQPNLFEDCEKFLNTIKSLKLYLIEFQKYESIKTEFFCDNCIIKKDIYDLIIIIIYNKYTFFASNKIQKT